MTGPVMVSCRPRELRAGMVAEAFLASKGWGLHEIARLEKKPGTRATTARQARAGQPVREAVPTRYHVWYEDIPGRRLLTPTTSVAVTSESYYAHREDDPSWKR